MSDDIDSASDGEPDRGYDFAANQDQSSPSPAPASESEHNNARAEIAEAISETTLICAICINRFTRPKLLPCLHTFCEDCLESYVVDNGGALECPVCGKEDERPVRALPDNTFLAGLIDVKDILSSEAPPKCQVCEENATKRCFECAQFLCEDCEQKHKKMKLGHGHKIMSLQEFTEGVESETTLLKRSSLIHPTVCPHHEGSVLNSYCETCDVPVCDSCAVHDHQPPDHHVRPLQESVDRQFNYLGKLLKETKKTKLPSLQQSLTEVRAIMTDIETQCDFAEIKLRDRVRREVEMVRKLEQAVVDEMEHKILGKRAVLDEQFQRLQQAINNVQDCCDFTESLLKYGNHFDMIALNADIETRLVEMTGTNVKLDPVESSAIEFVSNEDFHGSLTKMNHLGMVDVRPKPGTPTLRSTSISTDNSPRTSYDDETPRTVNGEYATPRNQRPELEIQDIPQKPILLSTPTMHLPPGTPPPYNRQPQKSTRDAVTMTTRDVGSMTTNGESPQRFTPLNLRLTPAQDGRRSRGPQVRQGRAGDDAVSARVLTPRHEIHRANVTNNPDGSYSVGYDPRVPGNHDLRVSFRGQPYGSSQPLAISMAPEYYQQMARGGRQPAPISIILNPPSYNPYYADDDERETGSADDDDEWLEGKPFLKIGKKGTIPGRFCGPRGVAVSHNEDIVVADRGNNRIQIFRKDGELNHVFSYRNFTRKFDPVGVAVTNSEQLVISDYDNRQVLLCDYDGRIIRSIGSNLLKGPWGVAVSSHGLVHVVDHPEHTVRSFSLDGTHVHSFGGKGQEAGQFNYPLYVACNSRDDIIVSDYCFHRVQACDYRGGYMFAFGTHGDREGQFYRPTGLACTDKDEIVVNDYLSNKVQLFKPNGIFMRHLNSDSKWLECPEGLAVASSKPLRVVVVDSGHHCVKVF
ncbi:tripartite motif-containing protein 2-like [Ptychodera flava]|uniref:tripartite motif-containing protein 2-like n=1 Tax=Ptychodera flava TaxID=63121 RepID=UPI00396A254C